MLTPIPTDLINGPSADDERQQRACEIDFDHAIQTAREYKKWPARVRMARDGIGHAVVEVVAARYRAAGWQVVLPPDSDTRALISPPSS